MDKRKQIEEILLTDYGCFDDFTVDKLCDLFAVVGRSEQLKCHHQYMNAGTLQGEAMKKCLKCVDYVKAL